MAAVPAKRISKSTLSFNSTRLPTTPSPRWFLAREHSFEALSESEHDQCYHVLDQLDDPASGRPEFAFGVVDVAGAAHEAGGTC